MAFDECVPEQSGTIAPRFSGMSLSNILTMSAGSFEHNYFRDCLARNGWEVRTKPPWISVKNDAVAVFPIPLIRDYNHTADSVVLSKLKYEASGMSSSISHKRLDSLYNWQEANTLIRELNAEKFEGYGDWRLPSKNELNRYLTIASAHASNMPLTDLRQMGVSFLKFGVYWTETPTEDDFYWGVNIAEKRFVTMGTSDVFQGLVLPVRGAVW